LRWSGADQFTHEDVQVAALEQEARHARPLRRLLQRRVENELSKRLLKGEIRTGDHVVVDYNPDAEGENKLTFTVIEQAPIPVDLRVASA
jgi:ATP-dependent Clp protease ATP-binding subunit ClpA